jgi:hypothetical protein
VIRQKPKEKCDTASNIIKMRLACHENFSLDLRRGYDTQIPTIKSVYLRIITAGASSRGSGTSTFVSAAFLGAPLAFGRFCHRICALFGCVCARIWNPILLQISLIKIYAYQKCAWWFVLYIEFELQIIYIQMA